MAILKSHSLLINELKADFLAISEKKVQRTVVCLILVLKLKKKYFFIILRYLELKICYV
jgi:hypothetical protein